MIFRRFCNCGILELCERFLPRRMAQVFVSHFRCPPLPGLEVNKEVFLRNGPKTDWVEDAEEDLSLLSLLSCTWTTSGMLLSNELGIDTRRPAAIFACLH